MAYFTIMAEMRGCYADNDSAYTFRADTRRELKSHLESMADNQREADAIGLSKKAVAGLAAEAWRRRKEKGVYPFVLPFHYRADGPSMGLFVYNASRADYLAQEERDS